MFERHILPGLFLAIVFGPLPASAEWESRSVPARVSHQAVSGGAILADLAGSGEVLADPLARARDDWTLRDHAGRAPASRTAPDAGAPGEDKGAEERPETTPQTGGAKAEEGAGSPGASKEAPPQTGRRETQTPGRSRDARSGGGKGTAASPGNGSSPGGVTGPTKGAGDGGRPHVYTNEDLLKYARPGDGAVDRTRLAEESKKQREFESDAQKRALQQPATDEYRAKLLADAQERVKLAREKLEQLKWLALSEKNPFVSPPALSEEQRKERAELSAGQRREKTEAQILEAQAELDAAQAGLREIEKRLALAR